MKIGIVGFQGDVSEHSDILKSIAKKKNVTIEIVNVRKKEQLNGLDGLIIPGGESTTIYKLLKMYDLFDEIKRLGNGGLPIMGTCAGLILLSSVKNDPKVEGLELLDSKVERNAYGRQIDSFMEELSIKGIGKYVAVFIRAPAISDPGSAEVLAELDGRIVMVRKQNILGLSFHPELTKDTRVHEYFLMIIGGGGYTSTGEKNRNDLYGKKKNAAL